MAKSNKQVFEVEGKQYAIKKPTARQNEDATMEYNRVFSKALQSGALLREKLDLFMREQGLWDNQKQEKYLQYIAELNDTERKLQEGGIKLSEAKELAFNMKGTRGALQDLIAGRNALDVNTAQGQAENARFNFLLVSCLVYNDTGKNVYNTADEYSEDGESPVAIAAAENFANQYFGLDKDHEKNLPENKFLTQYKFTDEEGRLIDSEGNFIDYLGRRVNENGRYIDENGELTDVDGNRVDENGEYLVEQKPFLDDDGNELGKDGEVAEKETPKKKRGRPKKEAVDASEDK